MEASCTICEIINCTQKGHIIYEDDHFVSFLDIRPLFIGHALLAPKRHVETLYDLPSEYGNSLLANIQKIGKAITHDSSLTSKVR